MWGDCMEPLVTPEVENLETVWGVILSAFQKVVDLIGDYVTLQIALFLGLALAAADIVLFFQNRKDDN